MTRTATVVNGQFVVTITQDDGTVITRQTPLTIAKTMLLQRKENAEQEMARIDAELARLQTLKTEIQARFAEVSSDLIKTR